jgi:hypothetical protein
MEKKVTVTKTQKEKHKLKGTWDAQAPNKQKPLPQKYITKSWLGSYTKTN